MPPTNSTTSNVSRRNFLKIAVGSFFALPVVDGGFITPAAAAYAREAAAHAQEDGGYADTITAEITIIEKDQVGIYVGDMKYGGDVPVVGAHVVLTSRFNGNMLEQDTNEKGIVVFEVCDLAEHEDGDDPASLDEYHFNGIILVTKDGYREVATSLCRVEGGVPLVAPTRSLSDDNDPYPRLASFDEWDILYHDQSFSQTTMNDGDHALRVQWRRLWSNDPVTVELRKVGDTNPLQTLTTTPANNDIDVTFKKPFLKTGDAAALPLDTKLEVAITQGNISAAVDLALTIERGLAESLENKGDDEELILTPINVGSGTNSKSGLGSWPNGIPVVGGTPIMEWLPDFPVNVCINPWGYFQITVKPWPSWNYKRDSGKDCTATEWGYYPQASAAEQFEKKLETANKMQKKASQAYDGSKVKQIKFATNITARANLQIMAVGKWDAAKAIFQGLLAGQINLFFGMSVTENFWAGPIPILISFGFDLSTILGLSCGIYSLEDKTKNPSMTDAIFNFDNWMFDYTNTGFTVTINLTPFLSAGVGVSGVASISIKGKFTLTLFFGFTYRGELDHDTHPLPHMVFGYSAQILVVLHFFLYTRSFNIKNWPYRTFKDNWENASLQAEAEEVDAADVLESMSLPELMNDMVVISDDMLRETAEFEDSVSLFAESDDEGESAAGSEEPVDWRDLCSDDVVAPLANGTEVRYKVIHFPAPGEEYENESAGPVLMAEDDSESIVELGAEPGDEATAVLQRDEVQARRASARARWRRREPSIHYVPIGGEPGSSLYLFAESDEENTLIPEADVDGLGRYGGVKPTADVILNKDEAGRERPVFGDPRIKVIDLKTQIDGVDTHVTCCFRIGTVTIAGDVRTRVILTVLDAGSDVEGQVVDVSDYIGLVKVIDFDISTLDVDHEELYDYDFGIAFTTHDGIDMVHMVVVSGGREAESPQLAYAATDLVLSYFNFSAGSVFGRLDPLVVSMRSNAVFQEEDGLYHCITNISCATDGQEECESLLIAYLDRIAATPEGVLSEDEDVVDTKVGFMLFDLRTNDLLAPDRASVDEAMGMIECASIYDLTLSPRIAGAYTIALSASRETFFYVLELNNETAVFDRVRIAAVLDDTMHLIPWVKNDCFLTSYPEAEYLAELDETGAWKDPKSWDRKRWVLQKAWWVDEEDGTPVLAFEPIGPKNFNFSTFGLNTSGTFIFWPQSREGDDGVVYDEDLNTISEDKSEEPVYQIRACRIWEDKFSDPFVVAEIDHDVQSLEIVPTHDRYAPVEVVSAEPLSLGHADQEGNPLYIASNLWYTSVPNVRCAVATTCYAPVPLVGVGGTLRFYVTIRNEGNSFLSGCDVQLVVHENQVFDDKGMIVSEDVYKVEGSTATIEFSEETIRESHWTPIVDGAYTNVEPDFSLAPGKCAMYVTEVSVPVTWTGDKVVSFVAYNPVVALGGSLTAEAVEDFIEGASEQYAWFKEYVVKPGTYRVHREASTPDTDTNRTDMTTITIDASTLSGAGVSDAPVRVWEEGASEPIPQVSDGDGAGSGDGSSSGSGAGTGTGGSTTGSGTTSAGSVTGSGTTSAGSSRPTSTGSTSTPHTADATLPAAVSAGLALVGTAALAYSHRRVQNECNEEDTL